MFLKKYKNMIYVFLLTLFIIPGSAYAYSSYIIPGGENIGIQINSKGIMIVGFYKINNEFVGHDAGLKLGDLILEVNGKVVNSINEMVEAINADTDKSAVSIKYERNGNTYTTNLKLIQASDGVYKTGLYVKDTISGIGTLTYIDPATKIYGALGHQILERNSGQAMEVKDGKIFKAEVLGIEKSSKGTPGEKNARYFSDITFGNIQENTAFGIFGNYSDQLPNKTLFKVAEPNEVKLGKAQILTVLKDEKVESFDIDIIKLNMNQKQKNILFNITDTRLLEQTGGVVQGMSGSPIIQNNMIIGAVTHVVVEDATKGYGIFIKYMLEEGEN